MDDFYPGYKPRPRKIDGPAGGILVFLLAMGLMIFVAAPVQYALGTWGLVVTEIMLLGLAALAAAASGAGLRHVFPLKLPTGRQAVGTLLLWAGYLGLALAATVITAYFFPQQVYGTGDDIGRVIGAMPLASALLISAIMPAICEEGLFRGYIQHCFRRVRSKWVTIIAVAAMFGIMHLSLYRLLPTFILGVGLCYLRSQSANMALPMLMHFVNNAFTVLINYAPTGAEAASAGVQMGEMLAYMPAMACFYALASPAAILIGTRLLTPPPPLGQRRSLGGRRGMQVAVAALFTALLLAGFIAGLLAAAGDAGYPVTLPAQAAALFAAAG